jgi:hypothetical protein
VAELLASVLAVSSQIVAVRPQVLPVRMHIAGVGADGAAVLANILPVSSNVRARLIDRALFIHAGPLLGIVMPQILPLRVQIGLILSDVTPVRADGGGWWAQPTSSAAATVLTQVKLRSLNC